MDKQTWQAIIEGNREVYAGWYTACFKNYRANNCPNADAMEKLNMIHRRAYGKNPLAADASVDFKLADYSTLYSTLA